MAFVDVDLVEAAKAIGPEIRELAGAAEQDRRLPRRVLQLLNEAGLQRMLTPRTLGGFETDPVTCAGVMETVAGYDSAAGWALQAGISGAWWSSRLPAEGVDEIYGKNPSTLMAAAFHPPQRAVPVDGGYRVSGRGPLASNVHDAEWLMLTAFVMAGDRPQLTDGSPEIIAVVIPTAEVAIIDTWYSLGMCATDSNDVEVRDVFVPARRTYRLVPEFQPCPHYAGPLYRFPGIGQTALIGAPVLLAIARAAISEFRDLATRKTPFGSMKTLRERTPVQAALAQAEGIVRSARLLFYDTLRTAWERTLSGEPSTLEQKADLLLAGAHATKSAATAVEMMHRLAGTAGIYRRNRLERHFRDAQTLRHHGFVSENRFETVGQVYLDVAPEFGMVAF